LIRWLSFAHILLEGSKQSQFGGLQPDKVVFLGAYWNGVLKWRNDIEALVAHHTCPPGAHGCLESPYGECRGGALKALVHGNGRFMINDTGVMGGAFLARGDDQIVSVLARPIRDNVAHVQVSRGLRELGEDCAAALSGSPIVRKEIAELLPNAPEQSTQMPDRLAVACESAGRKRLSG